jgi:hypothetical protein
MKLLRSKTVAIKRNEKSDEREVVSQAPEHKKSPVPSPVNIRKVQVNLIPEDDPKVSPRYG